MSAVVLAVHDMMGDALAQGSPTLEEPPASDKYLQLLRYLPWLLGLAVLTLVVVGGVVGVMVIRERRRSSRARIREAGEQPRPAPPTQAPLIPKHRYPAPGARPAPDPVLPDIDWGPPDPSVWGRPGQG